MRWRLCGDDAWPRPVSQCSTFLAALLFLAKSYDAEFSPDPGVYSIGHLRGVSGAHRRRSVAAPELTWLSVVIGCGLTIGCIAVVDKALRKSGGAVFLAPPAR